MLDIGFQELLVLMVLALLVFGPEKLPELGRRLGRAMREFRRASDEFRTTIETNLNLHEESILPPSTPVIASSTPTAEAPQSGAAASEPHPVTPSTAPATEPADGPRGLVPEPIGPFEETDTAGMVPAEPFCTRRGGRLLHRTNCAWARRIPEADRIALKTAAEGWEQGLRPCPVCDPEAPAAVPGLEALAADPR